MEPSLTALRPPALIFTGLGLGQMLSSFSKLAAALGLTALARAEARPAAPHHAEAWRSYAVYSGALSPRQYKSPGRLS